MDQQVTQTYNLFIDSSRNRSSGSKGDDYSINLQDSGVQAGNGEYIRLSLDNFSMAKTFSNVSLTNNNFIVRAQNANDSTETGAATANLPAYHYKDTRVLATQFGNTLADFLRVMSPNVANIDSTDVTLVTPVDPAGATSDDNVISFKISFKLRGGADADHQLQNVRVQFDPELSDSYALLGGDRVKDAYSAAANDARTSIDVDTSAANYITVDCRYPAQLQTTRHIYIRAPSINNTNIETHGLNGPGDSHLSDTAHSDILGRAEIPFDKNGFISYTAQTGREYFLNLHQKNLPHLRIRLTDQHNRPLCRRANVSQAAPAVAFGFASVTSTGGAETAAGMGTKQSIDGNLQFSAVLRVDVIKQRQVAELETKHHEPNVPARFSNGVVNQQRNGKDMFGVRPGY